MSAEETGNTAGADGERRVRLELRSIFDHACEVTAPFYNAPDSWGHSLKLYAQRALREAYPHLSAQDLSILLAVVERVHRNRPPGV